MSTYWAPAPSHHAYVTTVDGEAVSDYGAYVHESQTEDPEDTAAMDSLRKTLPVAQQVVADGSTPTAPKPSTSRKRHPVLNPWRCRSHLHVDLQPGYVVTRDGLLAP